MRKLLIAGAIIVGVGVAAVVGTGWYVDQLVEACAARPSSPTCLRQDIQDLIAARRDLGNSVRELQEVGPAPEPPPPHAFGTLPPVRQYREAGKP